jgi:hypothetical protein
VSEMPKGDRDALIKIAKARARQAEREADARRAVLMADVRNLVTAEHSARDELWRGAVEIAQEALLKANDQIRCQCADLGIPPEHAPELQMSWRSRSGDFSDDKRRGELIKLAEAKLDAVTTAAKTAIQAAALHIEEALIMGGLDSDEAKTVLSQMPTPEGLMPAIGLDDLGVKGWQPPDDAAAQLTTPMTPADRKRHRVMRAIANNEGKSDRAVAAIAGCDPKTVASYRRGMGEEFLGISAGDDEEAGV